MCCLCHMYKPIRPALQVKKANPDQELSKASAPRANPLIYFAKTCRLDKAPRLDFDESSLGA